MSQVVRYKHRNSASHSPASLILGVVSIALLLTTPAHGADWVSEPIPAYDQLFQHTNGWIGADGDVTVALTNGLTLWLYSDTLIGEIHDGHRHLSTMTHHSFAWQHGTGPASANMEWFYTRPATDQPASLITPANGRGYYWIPDSLLAGGKLFIFLAHIEQTDPKDVFGFRQTSSWFGEVSNPLAPPPDWQVVQRKIPFAQFGTNENYTFGSASLVTNGWIYLFGNRWQKSDDKMKTMILARAPETGLDNFAAWQFRARDGWTTNAADLADLGRGLASEYSVSWLPALRQYVLICTENGLSDKIMLRTAPQPWGPWSAATVVYRCPEVQWDKQIFCYAAKAHPMLATRPDELIVTYAANSFSFSQVLDQPQLYWPRFVRISLVASTSSAAGD